MADKNDRDDRITHGILGDINPIPTRSNRSPGVDAERGEMDESMEGGSRHDQTRHPGSREVTEGVTGGLGTETGGTRNYRSGTGATGGDIGNRPD